MVDTNDNGPAGNKYPSYVRDLKSALRATWVSTLPPAPPASGTYPHKNTRPVPIALEEKFPGNLARADATLLQLSGAIGHTLSDTTEVLQKLNDLLPVEEASGIVLSNSDAQLEEVRKWSVGLQTLCELSLKSALLTAAGPIAPPGAENVAIRNTASLALEAHDTLGHLHDEVWRMYGTLKASRNPESLEPQAQQEQEKAPEAEEEARVSYVSSMEPRASHVQEILEDRVTTISTLPPAPIPIEFRGRVRDNTNAPLVEITFDGGFMSLMQEADARLFEVSRVTGYGYAELRGGQDSLQEVADLLASHPQDRHGGVAVPVRNTMEKSKEILQLMGGCKDLGTRAMLATLDHIANLKGPTRDDLRAAAVTSLEASEVLSDMCNLLKNIYEKLEEGRGKPHLSR